MNGRHRRATANAGPKGPRSKGATAPPNEWPVVLRCPRPKIIPWQTRLRENLSTYFNDPDTDALA